MFSHNGLEHIITPILYKQKTVIGPDGGYAVGSAVQLDAAQTAPPVSDGPGPDHPGVRGSRSPQTQSWTSGRADGYAGAGHPRGVLRRVLASHPPERWPAREPSAVSQLHLSLQQRHRLGASRYQARRRQVKIKFEYSMICTVINRASKQFWITFYCICKSTKREKVSYLYFNK